METNRRYWLKQSLILLAGMGIVPIKSIAAPISALIEEPGNNPIRLCCNENPYGPSPSARKAMADNLYRSNRYSWELTGDLISAIAKKNDLTADNILLRSGSTEIIDLVVQYTAAQKGSLVIADPTFSHWSETAEHLGLKKMTVPLTADKRNDLTAMLQAIQPDTRMVYICNPNNPTGTICERGALVSFINEATKKTIVFVDEAYIDFSGQTSLSDLVTENKNLIITKTFSKIYGLASARVGYAIAHKDTIIQLAKLQSWPNGGISVVSVSAALATLNDTGFTKECYSLNEKARNYAIEQLQKLNIPCIPSHTNFIYFSLANYKKDFFEQLKNNNITGTGIFEEDGKWSRITVGTMDEMQKLIKAIT